MRRRLRHRQIPQPSRKRAPWRPQWKGHDGFVGACQGKWCVDRSVNTDSSYLVNFCRNSLTLRISILRNKQVTPFQPSTASLVLVSTPVSKLLAPTMHLLSFNSQVVDRSSMLVRDWTTLITAPPLPVPFPEPSTHEPWPSNTVSPSFFTLIIAPSSSCLGLMV